MSETWARAQKRPGGAGARVYISGTELSQALGGKVPEEVQYTVTVWDTRPKTVIIKLREAVSLNGR